MTKTDAQSAVLSAALALAIENKHAVAFSYKEELRLVEPHAVGRGSDGKVRLRAFQIWPVKDESDAHWRMFDVDKMEAPSFPGARPGYKKDDKQMPGGIIAQL